jgi:hypothetical protein
VNEGAGTSSEITQRDDNSMDHNDSNSAPPLMSSSGVSNGDSFGRDRLSADSTSSLMEPPAAPFAASNDSLSSPMEVI